MTCGTDQIILSTVADCLRTPFMKILMVGGELQGRSVIGARKLGEKGVIEPVPNNYGWVSMRE